jgi:hypothetical protein
MRRKHQLVGTAVGLAAVAALAGGCIADAGETMVIIQNQVPAEGCVVSSSVSDTYRPFGSLDASGGHGYLFTPVVQSRAETRAGDDPTRRLIAVQGATVRLEAQVGTTTFDFQDAPTEFSIPTSGSVPPGGTLGMGFDILLASHAAEIDRRLGDSDEMLILAEVVVFGKLAGSNVESDPFTYPLSACRGCLTSLIDSCLLLPGACRPFQDAGLDCSQEPSGS